MSEPTNTTPKTTTTTAPAPIATIASLSQHEGQTVTLRGWLYNLRASGKLLFPIFRDGTGTIQGIVPKAAVPEAVFETLKNLTLESSLTVTGKVRADSRAPSGYELDVENVEVLQRVPDETPFPITLKEHGVDFLMEHRHLWLRTPRQSAILRVRATIMRAAAEYFDINGFIRTDPPILTPNACEGTSELFEIDFSEPRHGRSTYPGWVLDLQPGRDTAPLTNASKRTQSRGVDHGLTSWSGNWQAVVLPGRHVRSRSPKRERPCCPTQEGY